LPNLAGPTPVPGHGTKTSIAPQTLASAQHQCSPPVALAAIAEQDISTDNLVLDRQLVKLKLRNDTFMAQFREIGTGIDVMQASIRLLNTYKDYDTSNSGNSSTPVTHRSHTTHAPASSRYSAQAKSKPPPVKTSSPPTGDRNCTHPSIRTSSAPTIDRETADFFESVQRLYQAMENRASWLADEISALDAVNQEQVKPLPVAIQCNICLDKHPEEDVFRMETCNHEFCCKCMRRYILTEINGQQYPISCPGCVAGKVEGGPESMTILSIPKISLVDPRIS
jgi:hypothetical protein